VQQSETLPSLTANEPSVYDQILNQAAARAQNYLRMIGERHAGVTPQAIQDLALLGGALPVEGQDPATVLKLLDEIGSPATVASM
jgi:hypothetical protein